MLNVTTSSRFYLALILCLLLIGVISHSMPSLSLCPCTETQNGKTLDACLVCQLQLGILCACALYRLFGEMLFSAGFALNSTPLEFIQRIPHPPTLLSI